MHTEQMFSTCCLGLQDEAMLAIDWSLTQLNELDISSTDLSEQALMQMFAVMPKLDYLAVPFCDGFTDQVSVNVHIDDRTILNEI
jgi:hypothetical protein